MNKLDDNIKVDYKEVRIEDVNCITMSGQELCDQLVDSQLGVN